jgi:hypothetical protein
MIHGFRIAANVSAFGRLLAVAQRLATPLPGKARVTVSLTVGEKPRYRVALDPVRGPTP